MNEKYLSGFLESFGAWFDALPEAPIPIPIVSKRLVQFWYELLHDNWAQIIAASLGEDPGGILRLRPLVPIESEGTIKLADYLRRVFSRDHKALRTSYNCAYISKDELEAILIINLRRFLGATLEGISQAKTDIIYASCLSRLRGSPEAIRKWMTADANAEPVLLHRYLTEVSWIALGWDHALPVPLKHYKREALFAFLSLALQQRKMDSLDIRTFKTEIIGERGLGLNPKKPHVVIGWEPKKITISKVGCLLLKLDPDKLQGEFGQQTGLTVSVPE